jgi:glycosyltransferase involved in cell wall biosynthesis
VNHLAASLEELGHRVFVFTAIEQAPVQRPLYLPYRAMGDLGEVDVLVAVRELLPLFSGIRARHRYFWTGDSYDQLQHLGLGDQRTICSLTSLLAVSNWQADRLCAVSGFPRQQTYILRNGHEPTHFSHSEPRSKKRLIYTSTPFRGLLHLPPIFQAVRKHHPNAELHVFSGMALYAGTNCQGAEIDRQYKPIFELLSRTAGVTLHGNVLQNQLARELCTSSIFVYPNTFEETSCISAIEAMAAGCAIITSRRGALPETIADAGIFIDGNPASEAYRAQFVQHVCDIMSDEHAWRSLHYRALARSRNTTWQVIAQHLTEKLANDAQLAEPQQPGTARL